MKIRSFVCASLSFAMLLALTTCGFADESATIDFDTDPGFSITDSGGAAATAVINTVDSYGDFTLNRDGGFEFGLHPNFTNQHITPKRFLFLRSCTHKLTHVNIRLFGVGNEVADSQFFSIYLAYFHVSQTRA